ncbi:pyridoxal-phosphate-dependent aminotransferase family protein [Allobaculum mucilyticum]|uniref:pyridoxal-phosphate-dependent aminotransferase family protein n=1 Tax=Allobaculum mucilyticum TaxID=2834459 RepID=UPI001E52F7D5|nr:aminotransferase class V-fold PLP-dependent enzyme [Allobaculum mucilyticum]UNT95036.1 aminotransferase class V-fold PLP-dependent enzyme [Allobaculum mucilyticum]
MINFTVGPVQSFETTKEIGGENVPYFRTPEFSQIVKESESRFLRLLHAPSNSRAVFITGSGSAGMEAAVSNVLNSQDKVLIINGGSFGQRFVDLCRIFKIPYEEIQLSPGEKLTAEKLRPYASRDFTALLVNLHETSTGVLYAPVLLGDFARENNLLLIVDAISAFMVDRFDMSQMGADVVITGSQKALACPPGVALIALSEQAQKRVAENQPTTLYFDLKDALKNAERGQTPFTPAVSVIIQLHDRLGRILDEGEDAEFARIARLAENFRKGVQDLPIQFLAESMSNGVTACLLQGYSAKKLFEDMKNKYGIWICPNGGELADKVFRIGHIGNITEEENQYLIECLHKELA